MLVAEQLNHIMPCGYPIKIAFFSAVETHNVEPLPEHLWSDGCDVNLAAALPHTCHTP